MNFLNPSQRDIISNKVYRTLTDTKGKMVKTDSSLSLTANDPSLLDMVARMMPSLSTRQIINTVGDKIVNFLFCLYDQLIEFISFD